MMMMYEARRVARLVAAFVPLLFFLLLFWVVIEGFHTRSASCFLFLNFSFSLLAPTADLARGLCSHSRHGAYPSVLLLSVPQSVRQYISKLSAVHTPSVLSRNTVEQVLNPTKT